MSVGILGSGFGLYGYLPALNGLGERVLLPERYRDKLLGRDDVRHLASDVEWVTDDEIVLARSHALIISRRPVDQMNLVRRLHDFPGINRLLLEKPIAPQPAEAAEMLAILHRGGKAVRVGFTFHYTPWARELADWLARTGTDGTITLDWRFRAHHYAAGLDNWKRHWRHGGGALRFYGIQLIALLAELGYTNAISSEVLASNHDEAESWEAVIAGPGRANCHVRVDSNADEKIFLATGSDSTSVPPWTRRLSDPFDESPLHAKLDPRVGILSQLCVSLLQGAGSFPSWYRDSVDLWSAIERQTSYSLY